MSKPGNLFGQELRKLRKMAGLTTEKLARKIGTHKGYVSGIENAKVNPPSVKLILKIGPVLNADVDRLLMIALVDKSPERIRSQVARKLIG